jgi:hypothetical protein
MSDKNMVNSDASLNSVYEDTQVLIEPGRAIEIAEQYVDYIESGFNVTLEDICSYLGCSYKYAINNISHKVKHIRITQKARFITFMVYNQGYLNISSEDILLMNKRILFHKTSFKEYLLKNIKVHREYVKFDTDYLLSQFPDEINNLVRLVKENKKSKIPLFYLNMAAKELYEERFTEEELPVATVTYFKDINELPDKFYSLKELQEAFNVQHEMILRRLIDNCGANKYMYGNLVRYDKNQINREGNLKIRNRIFRKLLEENTEREILREVIEEATSYVLEHNG